MSDDSPSRISFPKLNDSNFGTWAVMMEAFLTSKDLFTDIVEITVDTETDDGARRPQDEIDAEIEKKMAKRSKTKMAQARSEMILRVEPGQLAHMRSKDPLAVWQDLQTVHRARGFAASLALRKQFLLMKMSKGQSMTSWIGAVKEQAFNMTEAGMDVSEHDQILAITGGLPPSYSATISTLDHTAPSALTLDSLIPQLLSAETQHGGRSAANSRSPTLPGVTTDEAMAVSQVLRCYVCDETGHVKRDCPYRTQLEELKKKSRPIGTAAAATDSESDIGLDSDDDAF